jgi:hypothetical protein
MDLEPADGEIAPCALLYLLADPGTCLVPVEQRESGSERDDKRHEQRRAADQPVTRAHPPWPRRFHGSVTVPECH